MKQKNEKQVELYPVCSHSSGYEKIFPGVLSEISLLLGKEEGNNHCAVISKDQSCDLLLDFLQFRTGGNHYRPQGWQESSYRRRLNEENQHTMQGQQQYKRDQSAEQLGHRVEGNRN